MKLFKKHAYTYIYYICTQILLRIKLNKFAIILNLPVFAYFILLFIQIGIRKVINFILTYIFVLRRKGLTLN